MKKTDPQDDMTASQHIDQFIKELTDWRGKVDRSFARPDPENCS